METGLAPRSCSQVTSESNLSIKMKIRTFRSGNTLRISLEDSKSLPRFDFYALIYDLLDPYIFTIWP